MRQVRDRQWGFDSLRVAGPNSRPTDKFSDAKKEQLMTRLHRLIGPVFVVLCVTATLCAQNRSTRQLTVAGITNLSAQPGSTPAEVGNEVFIGPEVDEQFTKPQITGAISPARVSSAHVPTPGGSAFASTAGDVFTGFNALSHRDQRLSNNGNQFSL